MNISSKNTGWKHIYIIYFYNICIGAVEKLPPNNLKLYIKTDDLCSTLLNGARTACTAIGCRLTQRPLLRKQHYAACLLQAATFPPQQTLLSARHFEVLRRPLAAFG